MDRTHVLLSSIVATLLLAPALGTVVVGHAAAAVEDVDDRPDAYALEQGDRCITVEPVGDAGENVSDHYGYVPGVEAQWSSHGTTDRQESGVSQVYVYRGQAGDSLVFLHGEYEGDTGGGAVSMTISGQPEEANWVIEDDDYDSRDDRFQHDGSTSEIDWMWYPGRTDGGALRGLAESGSNGIGIDPAFSEDSYAAGDKDWPHVEKDLEWVVDNGNGTFVTLDQEESVEISHGGCAAQVPPEVFLSAEPSTPGAGANVTFEATGSSVSGEFAEYRWDLDGDGSVDAETDEGSYVHSYDEVDIVRPTVEVVDENGNTANATEVVNVRPGRSVSAVPDVPETVAAGESVTLDGSNSTSSTGIQRYEWSIEGGTEYTSVAPEHTFTGDGTVNVTLSVIGAGGATDETTTTVQVIDNDSPEGALDAPETAEVGETVTLDASSSADDEGVVEYRWDLDGDGDVEEGTEDADVAVSYDEVGEHTATVIVFDERGETDEATATVDVTAGADLSVDLTANRTTVAPGEAIDFEATATPESAEATYEYDFDDDSTAAGPSAVHAYDATGEYAVTVEATSADGRTAVDTVDVTVESDPTETPTPTPTPDPTPTPTPTPTPPDDGGDAGDGDGGNSGGGGDGGAGGGGGGFVPIPSSPDIGVTDASLSSSTVTAGERLAVNATVENEGDAEGTKALELAVDGTVVETRNVTLEESERRTVGIEHRFEANGTVRVTVNDVTAGNLSVAENESAAPEAAVTVANVSVPRAPIVERSTATVVATYENEGDESATIDAPLEVDGEVVATDSITVPPNGTARATFEHYFLSAGTVEVGVDGETVSVRVLPEDSGATESSGSAVAVASVGTPDAPLRAGTPAEIVVTYENGGDESATIDAPLEVDDEVVAVESVTVPAGETASVAYEHSFPSTGSYDIGANGTSASVDVGANGTSAGATPTPGDGDAGGSPQPAHVAVGVVVLLGVVVGVSRWV